MTLIQPVLLAGGSGTRLWPISRKSFPKQFSNIIGGSTLFQQAALRLMSTNIINFLPHITITNSEYRFIVKEQLRECTSDTGVILLEPTSRNTAPAVLAASLHAFKNDREAILFIAPSDHIISDTECFHNSLAIGLDQVASGNIVTFGVRPTRPETGYGYLELENVADANPSILKSFIEKPDLSDAANMIKKGNYLWNSGMFMFRAKDIIKAFRIHYSQLIEPVEAALENGESDLDFFRLQEEAWSKCDNISIDYAVMEHSKNLVAIPLSEGWSDLGGWDAVLNEMETDEHGVAQSSNAHAINCSDTLLRSESANQEIVGLGLKNIIAIAMPDAVLIASKDQVQDVKKVVTKLKSMKIPQADIFPKTHRPWGWFESLALGDRFQVKRIYVKVGASLSSQSHQHRSEHWVVVQGTAKATVGESVHLLSENESIYIPLGTVHRLENSGKLPMVLIEVQTGAYLGEDDIVRYEDKYSRL